MCARHPDTPVILDHLCGVGRNEVVEEAEFDALCRMARHPRVLVKFGPFQGMGRRQRPYRDLLAILRRVVDAFGPQRCMWESDSGGPIWMPEPAKDFPAAVTLIAEHADFLSDSDREWLLYKSAEGGGFDF